MNTIDINTDISGLYRIKKCKNGLVIQDIVVKNIITDTGLRMAGTSWIPSIFVGTGTAPPAPSDVKLASYRAHTNTVQSDWNSGSARSIDVPGEWVEGTGTWRFSEGAASGNITEVGIGTVTGSSPFEYALFSRALIVDETGSPISITVLPDEYLDVSYTLRSYCGVAPVVSTLNISGVDYEVTTSRFNSGNDSTNPIYPSEIYNPNHILGVGACGSSGDLSFDGDIQSSNDFVSNGAISRIVGSAVTTQEPSNFGAKATISYGLDSMVNGGIKGFAWRRSNKFSGGFGIHAASFRALVNPPIPKTNTNILTFGIRWTWGRKS